MRRRDVLFLVVGLLVLAAGAALFVTGRSAEDEAAADLERAQAAVDEQTRTNELDQRATTRAERRFERSVARTRGLSAAVDALLARSASHLAAGQRMVDTNQAQVDAMRAHDDGGYNAGIPELERLSDELNVARDALFVASGGLQGPLRQARADLQAAQLALGRRDGED
jgi:hypothetical protein